MLPKPNNGFGLQNVNKNFTKAHIHSYPNSGSTKVVRDGYGNASKQTIYKCFTCNHIKVDVKKYIDDRVGYSW